MATFSISNILDSSLVSLLQVILEANTTLDRDSIDFSSSNTATVFSTTQEDSVIQATGKITIDLGKSNILTNFSSYRSTNKEVNSLISDRPLLRTVFSDPKPIKIIEPIGSSDRLDSNQDLSGGNISVTSSAIIFQETSSISGDNISMTGGNISITPSAIIVGADSSIFGDNIYINTTNFILEAGGNISGGNISISASESIIIRENSSICGDTIYLDTSNLLIQGSGSISTLNPDAIDSNNYGGSISINSSSLDLIPLNSV